MDFGREGANRLNSKASSSSASTSGSGCVEGFDVGGGVEGVVSMGP